MRGSMSHSDKLSQLFSLKARLTIVLLLVVFLFEFFLPLVPYTGTMGCTVHSSYEPCSQLMATFSGYHSIGYILTGSGASYAEMLGSYIASNIANLLSIGVLFLVAFPIIVACVGLLEPEIIRLSRFLRIGIVVFGASAVTFSGLALLTIASDIASIGMIGIGLAVSALALFAMGTFILGFDVLVFPFHFAIRSKHRAANTEDVY